VRPRASWLELAAYQESRIWPNAPPKTPRALVWPDEMPSRAEEQDWVGRQAHIDFVSDYYSQSSDHRMTAAERSRPLVRMEEEGLNADRAQAPADDAEFPFRELCENVAQERATARLYAGLDEDRRRELAACRLALGSLSPEEQQLVSYAWPTLRYLAGSTPVNLGLRVEAMPRGRAPEPGILETCAVHLVAVLAR
jgi:hypothetical protein